MKIEKGATRLVLIFKSFVIKIPNFTHSWYNFLCGLCGNITERDTYRYADLREDTIDAGTYFGEYTKYSDLLCPVLWSSWGGWILIMRKADVEKHMDEVDKLLSEGKPTYLYLDWVNNDYGGDDKPSNYGYLNGRLVKIDYGS